MLRFRREARGLGSVYFTERSDNLAIFVLADRGRLSAVVGLKDYIANLNTSVSPGPASRRSINTGKCFGVSGPCYR